MRIAILGAGFTGLTAALRLLEQGYEVSLFEKEKTVGGLAGGFKEKDWSWTLEKSYHHWFTSDSYALNLAKELNQKIITKRPQTNFFINGDTLPFDSPLSLLKFPYLPITDRLRVGFFTFYLKYLTSFKQFEGKLALPWIKRYMGEKATHLLWEPLFTGKFRDDKQKIALSWFWARIKARTPSLAYPEGGFQKFADRIAEKITNLGGQVYLDTEITLIEENLNKIYLKTKNKKLEFDKIIVTLPTPIFIKITPSLPKDYLQKISSIDHLSALNLILILDKPFLEKTYWLNITDKRFPFLILAEHTNFMDPKNYNNQHILYIGNYLPNNHPYLKLDAKDLFKIYQPFLLEINPNYTLNPKHYTLFTQSFAQPVMTVDYPKFIPDFQTPLENVYLANMDMVYPWDRGTNWAIEQGEKVANYLNNGH